MDMPRDPLWRNTVSIRHVANVLKINVDDIQDAGNALNITTLNSRYERHEVRKIIATLIVRTRDLERLERLRLGMTTFADEPDPLE